MVSLVSTLVASAVVVASSAQAECTNIHLVVAPDASQPTGLGPQGQQFLADLASALPTKTASTFIVGQTNSNLLASSMAKYVTSYATSCPNAVYAIGGYAPIVNATELTIGVKAFLSTGRNPSAALVPRVKATVTFNCNGNAYCLWGSEGPGNVVDESNPFGVL